MSLSYLQQEASSTHPDAIWALSWTPQDQIITGCADGHLRVFSAPELSAPIHEFKQHPTAITSLSTSSSGKQALSSSLDGAVTLVDTSEGSVLGKIETGREKIAEGEKEVPAYACAIHPESKAFAWAGRSSKIALRSMGQEDHNGSANGESSGRGLLGSGGSIVDIKKGKFVVDLQFSPDGQQLAVATEQGHIVIIDTETQEIVATYTSHAMTVRTLSWSSDSQWLFSGSDDHRIVLHDVRAGSTSGSSGRGEGAVAIMQGHQSWVLKVATSPDNKLLGSGGADKMVKLWDIGQRACVSTSSSSAEVWGFAWQPAAASTYGVGKQFAVAGDDRIVSLFRAAGSA